MTARPIAWLTLLLVLSSSCGAADPSHTCPANQPLLVVVPDLLMGITNQLMTAINGIFLGIESKRNICLGGFYGTEIPLLCLYLQLQC